MVWLNKRADNTVLYKKVRRWLRGVNFTQTTACCFKVNLCQISSLGVDSLVLFDKFSLRQTLSNNTWETRCRYLEPKEGLTTTRNLSLVLTYIDAERFSCRSRLCIWNSMRALDTFCAPVIRLICANRAWFTSSISDFIVTRWTIHWNGKY